MAYQYIREDEADITLKIDGVEYPGEGISWATYAGGALSAAGSKTRPGGMGKQKAQGGPATRGDTTLTIQNSDLMVGFHKTIESRVGKGECEVTVQFLTKEGAAIPGAQNIVTGILKEATLPGQNYDSPAVGMYQVVIDSDEDSA